MPRNIAAFAQDINARHVVGAVPKDAVAEGNITSRAVDHDLLAASREANPMGTPQQQDPMQMQPLYIYHLL